MVVVWYFEFLLNLVSEFGYDLILLAVALVNFFLVALHGVQYLTVEIDGVLEVLLDEGK